MKLILGKLNFNGYTFGKQNTILNFNFSENYPIFKYKNNDKHVKLLLHLQNIQKTLREDIEYEKFKFYFITGKKSVGKITLILYIINRLLNIYKKVYY